MNVSALLKLAAILRKDASRKRAIKFDMCTWGRASDERDNGHARWKPALSCGTTGCALGVAALSGQFPGLTYQKSWMGLRISHEELQGYEAAQSYFGITEPTAQFLFSHGAYPPNLRKGAEAELEVARRLEMVAGSPQIAW